MFISTRQLAERWSMHPDSLRHWRSIRKGPPWVQLENNHIRYRLADIEEYETENEIG